MPAPRQWRSHVGATILRMGRAVNRWLAIVYATAVGNPAAPKKLPKVAMMVRRAYSPLPATPSKRAAAGPESNSIPCWKILAARDPSDGLLRMAHRIFNARALVSATPRLREFVQAPASRGVRAEPARGFQGATALTRWRAGNRESVGRHEAGLRVLGGAGRPSAERVVRPPPRRAVSSCENRY